MTVEYSVFDKSIDFVKARTESEALDKFWKNKNKESYEIDRVINITNRRNS